MQTRRTPCVGICSTTYGDLVCRGCKRFAHEIVQWNGYDEDQQSIIWSRLNSLRDEVTLYFLQVSDELAFAKLVEHLSLHECLRGHQVFEVLRHLVVHSEQLAHAGLSMRNPLPKVEGEQAGLPGLDGESLAVMRVVDAEIYARSQAHYEHCFKVLV